MNTKIPDHDLRQPETDRSLVSVWDALLETEVEWRKNLNLEAEQRRSHRKWVFLLSVVVLAVMMVLLAIAVGRLTYAYNPTLPASVQLAAYVAPIASVTVITMALPFGTFRGYRERDEKEGVSGLTKLLQGSGGAV